MQPPPSGAVFWYEQKKQTRLINVLKDTASADVIVVGGGMTGLTCAERLADLGAKVILLEREFCGAGASGKTSGFITPDSELELSDLCRNRGAEQAKVLWEFVSAGVEHIRKNIQSHRIDCDFQVQDSLFIAKTPRSFPIVEEEHKARIALNYKSTLYDAKTIRTVIGSSAYGGGVRYPDTFGMNSYLYCQGMKHILEKKGVDIFEGSPVSRITSQGVECASYRVIAPQIIVCTDRFLPELHILPRDMYHAQTFLSISKPLTDAEVRMIFPHEKLMVWDTDLIYQYFRITGDQRLLFGAASMLYTYERQERSDTRRIFRKIHNYLHAKFPDLSIEIESIWPGMLGVSKDFVPIAAQDILNPSLFFVGGAAGLPWCAALGTYIAEKALQGRADLDSEFTPKRPFPLGHTVQSLIGTPSTFALSHGIAKYFR